MASGLAMDQMHIFIQVLGNDFPPLSIYIEGLYRGAMTRDDWSLVPVKEQTK